MTSAPKSASCAETALPATSRDRSTTRMPSGGPDAGSNDFSCRLIGGARRGRQSGTLAVQRWEENRAPPPAFVGPSDRNRVPREKILAHGDAETGTVGHLDHALPDRKTFLDKVV